MKNLPVALLILGLVGCASSGKPTIVKKPQARSEKAGAAMTNPTGPSLRLLYAQGEGDETRVEVASPGHFPEGARLLLASRPARPGYYALILLNDGKIHVLVSGEAGRTDGEEMVTRLMLVRSDGTQASLAPDATAIAVFAQEPVSAEDALACATGKSKIDADVLILPIGTS